MSADIFISENQEKFLYAHTWVVDRISVFTRKKIEEEEAEKEFSEAAEEALMPMEMGMKFITLRRLNENQYRFFYEKSKEALQGFIDQFENTDLERYQQTVDFWSEFLEEMEKDPRFHSPS